MGTSASRFLARPLTRNYRPPVSLYAWHPAIREGRFSLFDVPAMTYDPAVQIGLATIAAPIFSAKWEVKANSPDVKQFVDGTIRRFWNQDLPKALELVPWGTAVGEVEYRFDDDSGFIQYAGLMDVMARDTRAILTGRELIGCRVTNNAGAVGLPMGAVIEAPRFLFIANEPKYGNVYGLSRLRGAWSPWMEKRGAHGAIDIRRVWFFKCAFGGGTMRYPPEGTVTTSDGTQVSYQDYAREVAEKTMTGDVMALPYDRDPDSGEQRWEYTPAGINGSAAELIQYPQELDKEIWMGMGVHPEVIIAQDVGGGWSGRSVPFLSFLAGVDRHVSAILSALKQCVLNPLVEHNFGDRARFEVSPISLVPKEGDPGSQPGPEPKPTGGNPQQITGMSGGMGRQPVQLSQETGLVGRTVTLPDGLLTGKVRLRSA